MNYDYKYKKDTEISQTNKISLDIQNNFKESNSFSNL